MIYFDCNCEVGPRNQKDPAAPWSVHDVLRSMDHCGIAGALVVHTLSYADDPVRARKALMHDLAVAPDRLFPVWILLPPDAGDFEQTPAELLDAMARDNVRAVKLYPGSHNWPLDISVIGPTLAALEKKRVLTMINFDELPGGKAGQPNQQAYETLGAILHKFPRLPVLLQNIWWSCQRVITALMARHRNLHIEFSCYQINRGIEEYVRRFGAERLLFGTGLPAKSAGAARAYVDYAQAPASAREAIAGRNLERLLDGVVPGPPAAHAVDPLRDLAAEGQPMNVPVLDAHCHLLQEGGDSAGMYVMYKGDADGLLEIKNTMGIERTAVMSWSGPISSDLIDGNDVVARAVEKYPGRFLGVCYLNPTHQSPEELLAEVRKRVEAQGFVGLKPYNRQSIRYSDPLYVPCWEYANEKGLYSLLHIGGAVGGMDVVEEMAATYPKAQWVIAHSGGSFGMARSVVAGMKKYDNIWAELTLTPVTNGVIEWMVGEVGDDRVLFGTDAPMRDPRPQFGWVVWSDLPVESRKRILGENFQRLLGMRSA